MPQNRVYPTILSGRMPSKRIALRHTCFVWPCVPKQNVGPLLTCAEELGADREVPPQKQTQTCLYISGAHLPSEHSLRSPREHQVLSRTQQFPRVFGFCQKKKAKQPINRRLRRGRLFVAVSAAEKLEAERAAANSTLLYLSMELVFFPYSSFFQIRPHLKCCLLQCRFDSVNALLNIDFIMYHWGRVIGAQKNCNI